MIATTTHQTTADWVIGSVALAALVAFVLWLGWRTSRFARGLLTRRAPEAAVRVSEQGAADAPSLTIPALPPVQPQRTASRGAWYHRPVRVPMWLAVALMWLGAWYVLATPLGHKWVAYGVGLAFAIWRGVATRRRYRSTVLYRGPRSIVTWGRWTDRLGHEPDVPEVVRLAQQVNAGSGN